MTDRKIYYSPDIKIELLEKQDVLLESETIPQRDNALGSMSSFVTAVISGDLFND